MHVCMYMCACMYVRSQSMKSRNSLERKSKQKSSLHKFCLTPCIYRRQNEAERQHVTVFEAGLLWT